MLGGARLTVSLARGNTCFAYLSSKYSTNSQEFECIQVQHGDTSILLWAVFSSGVPEGSLQINPMYSRTLGLAIGSEIFVNSVSHTRTLESLFIEADSPEDQVILEHNQVLLKTVFLDQVRLVKANQKAVVWISPSMPIVFTPDQTGILVNQSNIFVRMKVLGATPQPVPEEKKAINKKNLLKSYMKTQKKITLRALPIDSDGKKDLIHPYTVFIHEDFVDENVRKSTLTVALMKSVPFTNAADDVWGQELCVEVVPVDSVIFRSLCREVYSKHIPTVLIPKSLNKIIDVENGTMIMLSFLDSDKLRQPDEIEIITYTNQNNKESAMELVEKFIETVVQNTYSGKVFLINHNKLKQNQLLTTGFIKFRLSPVGLTYTTLNQEAFRNCKISAKCLNISEMEDQGSKTLADIDNSYCRSIKPLEVLVENVISHIYFDVHRDARFKKCSDLKSSVLVTGPSGTGKSTLCHLVEKEISLYSYNVHCRFLKGRKDIATVLLKALQTCMERKPSLLILDDVDALLPATVEGLSPQDIATYNGLASEVKNVLTSSRGVATLMTARGVTGLHPTLRHFTGRPLYTAHFSMPDLLQEDRIQLFQHLVTDKTRDLFVAESEDVVRLAMDTPSHTVREILDYYNKKVFAAIKKKNANPCGPKPRLIEDVTRDVERAKAFDVWGPLGGMEDVKAKLDECLFWPIMYPALFPSQSCGILLYGPPGTGKSLIGSCLARMSNMSMITVKGPELLSKYIGQSEAAVREVFDRADMKRPCILFFDEFDSLAPKRGHDSTGVTDRVVNQLLARLDGAEGGARGPVIAATSRPDLVDPALLRTGRLQTHLYCPLPDTDGRLAVLRTLSGEFHLSAEVDLGGVAAGTPGYSAADLKALLVTAQLARLDLDLQRMHQVNEPTLESVVITSEDIHHALQETKPSLSEDQKAFYNVIYRRFRGDGSSSAPASVAASIPAVLQNMQRQRVTLA